ncbi:MAG TPA: hypothetical protein VFB04_05835 [Terriglobales bacterium]|nr:hypothetical protein [Terriglobales bacterium]
MRIDHTHRKWFIVSLVILAVAVIAYIPYRQWYPQGVGGGTAMGLIYGSVGFAFMIFAGLLGARKKVPIWRVGRAQTWMRGHIWLGLLSFPLILLHGGFKFGFGLTHWLMWIFLLVFISGIFGAVLQHYMPKTIKERIPMETIYEQIGRVRGQLVDEANNLVEQACATLTGNLSDASVEQRAAAAGAGTMGGITVATGLQIDEDSCGEMRGFFQNKLKPFLEGYGARRQPIANRDTAKSMFDQLRLLLPSNLHPTVEDLESICEEKRELDQQTLYHRILHGWLLVHIPLSYAVLVLGAIHAIKALAY